MNASFDNREVHCNDSVRVPAAARWNVFGNVSGDGKADAAESVWFNVGGHCRGSREPHQMS